MRRTTESRAAFRTALACAVLLVFVGCSSAHRGFGSGRSVALYVSEVVELRCARPVVDGPGKTVSIAWVAAKTPEAQPPIEELALTVFDDRDGDHQPGASEILDSRSNPVTSAYILFGPFKVTSTSSVADLRAILRVKTARKQREVNWELMRRKDLY